MVNEGRLVADGKPQDVLKDTASLHQHRLVPTSLLDVNLQYIQQTGRFLRAEQLATTFDQGEIQVGCLIGFSQLFNSFSGGKMKNKTLSIFLALVAVVYSLLVFGRSEN